jgi:hypothetical protein
MIKRRPVPGVVSDPRSWGLFAVALIYLSRGLAYTFTTALEPLPYGLDVLALYISIHVYGVLWLFGAALGFWMSFWRVRKIWGAALMTAMPTLWGLAYLVSWLATDNSWTGIFVYGCLSVIAVSFGVQQPQKVVFLRGGSGRSSD